MSGVCNALVMSGTHGLPQAQTISCGSVTFNTTGTLTMTGGGSTASPANWSTILAPGIGRYYWINITRTSGTGGVNFSAAQGAWTQMNDLSISATGAAGSCSGTYQIASDSGGSNIVATGGSISVNNTA